ncbi:MAG: DUF4424 family protein [Fidelibacterota bacterium]|nr:MAG: DUF4424 family protein [Candidatus Neomarinimicrobiota bacterium]
MARSLLLIFGGLLAALHAQTTGLEFNSERIAITVQEHACRVTGEYHFRNHSPQPVTGFPLFYPFPVSPELPFPDSILIVNGRTGAAAPYSRIGSGILFHIAVSPMGHSTYTVHYRQPAPARRFEYILETTQKWQQPLASAEFEITVPNTMTLTGLSLDVDRLQESDSAHTYHITRQNFMPDANLIIQWEMSHHEP